MIIVKTSWMKSFEINDIDIFFLLLRIRNFGQSLQFKIQTTLNSNCSRIKYIENVKVKLSLTFLPRAFMLMYLTSPSGTISQLLYPRVFDAITRRNKYKNLVVSSLHYWGEDPNGNWTVSFKNSRPSFGHSGKKREGNVCSYLGLRS